MGGRECVKKKSVGESGRNICLVENRYPYVCILQLEKLNKELTETLSQQKDAIQSSSSALQTEQDNHRKTAGDLAKIRANFEKLRRAHEEALGKTVCARARVRGVRLVLILFCSKC